MANIIKLKRSATTGNIPTTAQIDLGEMAMNTTDGKLFLKRSVSAVESIVELGKPIVTSITHSPTLTLNCLLGTVFDITLAANTTITFSNATDATRILLRLKQDATGGRTLTFGAGVRFGTDVPSVTLSTSPNKLDYIALIFNSTSATYDVLSFSKGF